MVNFTAPGGTFFEPAWEPIELSSSKETGFFNQTIANASEASGTFPSVGLYEITVISLAFAENPPHTILIRNGASTIDYFMIGVPIGGAVTRRMKIMTPGQTITVRNNNSVGSVLVRIYPVNLK